MYLYWVTQHIDTSLVTLDNNMLNIIFLLHTKTIIIISSTLMCYSKYRIVNRYTIRKYLWLSNNVCQQLLTYMTLLNL